MDYYAIALDTPPLPYITIRGSWCMLGLLGQQHRGGNMKKQRWILLSALVLGICSQAYATDDGGADSNFYGSLGIGTISFDESVTTPLDPLDNAKSWVTTLGWKNKLGDAGSVAVEYSYTKDRGDSRISAGGGAISAPLNVETHGLYGVYRSSGDIYLKAKGGLLYVEVSGEPPFSSDSATQAAYGLGFGAYVASHGYFEAEFTNSRQFTLFAFGIGLLF
jgi:hypothetical protein